jgi:hypothetical protein
MLSICYFVTTHVDCCFVLCLLSFSCLHLRQKAEERAKNLVQKYREFEKMEYEAAQPESSSASKATFSASIVKNIKHQVDRHVAAIEASRDLSRILVVVDMDMFYAAGIFRSNFFNEKKESGRLCVPIPFFNGKESFVPQTSTLFLSEDYSFSTLEC